MDPSNQEAVKFLRLVYPDGPWCLTAISVDRKNIETQTFMPDQEQGLLNWLKKWNGKRNLYWHVNPPIKPLTKKAEREDIKEVCYLHVDVDPRAGESVEAEQLRILNLLRFPPEGIPTPTFIIFSGGGFQGFWKLEEPIPINGDVVKAEAAKLFNMQLEYRFGADNCHNIDRLMRLVGTVNIPDAKKKKKGRKELVAEIVERNGTYVYPLSSFKPATQVQFEGDSGFHNGSSVKIGSEIPRINSVDDLNEWNVPDRVKVIIVQGRMPDERKQGDDSRSAWLFDCICQLVRCGVPDNVIFGILTDGDLKISESVLDKGKNAEKYARRQIERAKEEAIDPHLRDLNERHAVIANLGGKCRIVEEIFDYAMNRPRLTRQTFDDFRNRYMHVAVEIGKDKDGQPRYMPLGKWWLQHAKRKQYDTMVFAPGQDVPGVYNLWKGFACEPIPGDCSKFLRHMFDNICDKQQGYYDYLIGWMARCVQLPASPGQTAVVLRGRQGTGKSFFAKTFGALFGRHFLQVADPKHLVGSFNAHLRDCVVLFSDEAFYAGDKKHESVLKMLITEEVISIEAKGIDVEAAPNFVHCIFASNNDWVVPAGQDERRFFVLDVSEAQKQNSGYFRDLQKELDSGGREALLHFLLNYDLTEFEVRHVPKTKALQEQKLLSLTPDEEWWYKKLMDGRVLDSHTKWHTTIKKEALISDFTTYLKQFNVARRSNETSLGKFLSKVIPGIRRFQKREAIEVATGRGDFVETQWSRPYYYEISDLATCRKTWNHLFGENEWPQVEDDNEQPTLPTNAPF